MMTRRHGRRYRRRHGGGDVVGQVIGGNRGGHHLNVVGHRRQFGKNHVGDVERFAVAVLPGAIRLTILRFGNGSRSSILVHVRDLMAFQVAFPLEGTPAEVAK